MGPEGSASAWLCPLARPPQPPRSLLCAPRVGRRWALGNQDEPPTPSPLHPGRYPLPRLPPCSREGTAVHWPGAGRPRQVDRQSGPLSRPFPCPPLRRGSARVCFALRAALHKRLRARGLLRAALRAGSVAMETGAGLPGCGVWG